MDRFAGRLDDNTPRDRLTTTLFLTALLHGIVIIGVSFSTSPPSVPESAPTFEVLLLHTDSPAEEAPNTDGRYLAQRSQAGAGTTPDPQRAASPESSMFPAANDGLANGNGLEAREASEGTPRREMLASRVPSTGMSLESGREQPARENETPLAMAAIAPSPVIASAADDALQLRGEPRELVVRADTRESALAPYLNGWRRKVERLGTLNYPRDTRRRNLSGNTVVAVTVRADGALGEISVQQSSGNRALDQAALNILKLAAPFDPFPTELRERYDQLHFAYEWQFLGTDARTNLNVAPVPAR